MHWLVLDNTFSFARFVQGVGNNEPDRSTGKFNFVTVGPGWHTIQLRVQLHGDINNDPRAAAARMFVLGGKR